MSPFRLPAPALAALAVLLILAAASCSAPPDPRECILQALADAVRSVRAGDMDAAAEFVSDDYSDRRGNNRRAILQLLRFHLRQHGSVHVRHKIDSLEIPGDGTADLVLVAIVAGTPISLDNPLEQLNADILRIDLALAEEDDCTWRVTGADWKRATIEEMF